MRIGTHNGRFHADDVFAIAMLKHLYDDAQVIRSRKPDILAGCDIIVDVGGGKYDHHTTEKTHRDNGIPYASAGLVWRDFGGQVVQDLTPGNTESIVKAVDDKLIQGIDAVDNGFELQRDARIKGVSEIMGGFNPPWNSSADEDEAFLKAVRFAGTILKNQVQSEASRLAAVEVVETAFTNRSKQELLVLNTFCPWQETLLHLDADARVLFAIFPDRSGEYRIQTVPAAFGSFEARKKLPEAWAGKEHEQLGELIGIPDAVFCHPARFIAGAKSKGSIMKMAELAMQSTSP